MTHSKFGWDLPPGTTSKDIEDHFREDENAEDEDDPNYHGEDEELVQPELPSIEQYPATKGVEYGHRLDSFILEFLGEFEVSRKKFEPFHSFHEALAVIHEEFLELQELVYRRSRNPEVISEMELELIQIAAMCFACYYELPGVPKEVPSGKVRHTEPGEAYGS
jgi:hypothetical protein